MTAPTAAARGREVRQRLVRATAELIAERGWTAVSTRMAAERAGVAAGLVHYHFASLQALRAEAVISTMRGLLDGLGPLLERAETPDDALDLLLGSLDRYTGHDQTSLLLTEAYLAATRDENLRQAIGAIVADLRRQLAEWLGRRGVDAPEQTAAVLAAAMDGLILHRALNSDLTAAAAAPVLRRILAPAGGPRGAGRKAGGRR